MIKKLAPAALLICIPLLWLGLVASLALHLYLDLLDHAQDATNQVQILQQSLKAFNLQANQPLQPFRPTLDAIQTDLSFIQTDFKRYQPLIQLAKNVTPYRADLETTEYLIAGGQNLLLAANEALDAAQIALNDFNNLASFSIPGLEIDTQPQSGQALLDENQLARLEQSLQQIASYVKQGMANFNRIPYSLLKADAPLTRAVDQFRAQFSTLSNGLDEARTGLAVARRVLGFDEPATFLILLNDADELRPNGGFAGNYTLLTLWHSQIVSFKLENSYQPDDTILAKGPINVPAPYNEWWPLRYAWGLRDVSLTPDWPDTVQNIQQLLYQEGVSGNLTGAIAFNPGFIKNLLQTSGPVRVLSLPEYDENVDATNFVERIHYHQALDERNQDLDFYQRKKFIRYLAGAVLAKIKQLPKQKLPEIGKDTLTALEQRDLLLYLSDPTAQKIIDKMGWGGRLETRQDCLCVADTSESGNKTNSVVSQTVSDKIGLNLDGSATHQVVLTYNYTGTLADYQSSQQLLDHVAYNRFYLVADSRIIARSGFDDSSGVVQQYGREVWGQLVALQPGQKRDFVFSWQTPPLVGIYPTSNERVYNLTVQKQPGSNFYYHVEVKPPEGKHITLVTGVTNPIINRDGSTVLFDGLLTNDLTIKLVLSP